MKINSECRIYYDYFIIRCSPTTLIAPTFLKTFIIPHGIENDEITRQGAYFCADRVEVWRY